MIVEELEQEIEQDSDPEPGPSRQEVEPTRSGRRRFLPNRFEDFVPSSRTAVPHVPELVQDTNPPAGTHSPSPSPSASPSSSPSPSFSPSHRKITAGVQTELTELMIFPAHSAPQLAFVPPTPTF